MKRTPTEIIQTAIAVAMHAGHDELAIELGSLADMMREARTICKFAADAAVKHTRESVAWRESGRPDGVDHVFDRQCVGRLHNAAKRSRALLEAGMCSLCSAAATAGDTRTGECPECERILVGDLMKR